MRKKQKIIQRVLSLACAMVMCFSLLPTGILTAYANTGSAISIGGSENTDIQLVDGYSELENLTAYTDLNCLGRTSEAGEAYALYDIQVERSGEYELTLTYASAKDNSDEIRAGLYLNDSEEALVSYATTDTTGGWTTFADFPVSGTNRVALEAGTYTLKVAFETVGFNVQELKIVPYIETITVTGVALDQTEATVGAGDTFMLDATVSPADATDKTVRWSSSDMSVATVDQQGNVTAVAAGETTITVKTTDGGYEASCKLTVEETSGAILISGESDTTIALAQSYRALENLTAYEEFNCLGRTVNDTEDPTYALYDIKIETTGRYKLTLTHATDNPNGEEFRAAIHVYAEDADPGAPVVSYKTNGTTGGWTTFADFPADGSDVAELQKGTYILKIDVGTRGYNLQELKFAPYTEVIPVTAVALNQNEATANVGDTIKLTATVIPENATNQKVTWSSSNTAVATVDQEGNVIAVAVGETAITVKTTDGGYEAVCAISVENASDNNCAITISKKSSTVAMLAETYKELMNLNARYHTDQVADGDLTGEAPEGAVTYLGRASETEEGFALYDIKVEESGRYELALTYASGRGDTDQVRAGMYIYKEGATDTTTTTAVNFATTNATGGWWTFDDFPVNGASTVKLEKGTYMLKVAMETRGYNLQAVRFVPCKDVTGVTLDKNAVTATVGDTFELTATVTPEDATVNTVQWSSSNEAVAKVDANGKVTAVAAGETTITVKTTDGEFTAICMVTVLNKNIQVSLESESGKVGNIFANSEAYDLHLKLANTTSSDIEVTINASVKANGGWQLLSLFEDEKITIQPGKENELDVALDLASITQYGAYKVEAEIKYQGVDGEVTQAMALPFSRVMSTSSSAIPYSQMGVCTHFAQLGDLSEEEQNRVIQNNLDLIQKAGIKWIRDEMYWTEEPKGNVLVLDLWERYVSAATERDINILLCLGYGHTYYGGSFPHTEEQIAAFANYCAKMAQSFPQIKNFEIWNEWNGGSLGSGGQAVDSSAAAYAKVVLAASKAIKAVRPDANIIAGATVGGSWPWIRDMMNVDGVYEAIDAVSMHPYCYPTAPENNTDSKGNIAADVNNAYNIALDKGKDAIPVWLTEVGWPTSNQSNGVSEERAAAYIVRVNAYAKANPDKLGTITMYDFQDDGYDNSNNEAEFGMIQSRYFNDLYEPVPWAAKPAYVAACAYNSLVNTATFVKEHKEYGSQLLHDNRSVYAYEFERADGSTLMMMWANDGFWKTDGSNPPSVDVIIKTDSSYATCYDMYGNAKVLKAHDGQLAVTLSEQPSYLIFHTHTMVKTDAKAPTKEAEGNIEYYTCPVCGKIFRDTDGKEEITKADTVIERLPGLYEIVFDQNKDDTGTIAPGAVVEIDGVAYTLDANCTAWIDHTDAKLVTTYKYRVGNSEYETYPTNMYVWHLTATDENADGKYDAYAAERVKQLDNFFKYEGTSIRINFSSNGIRFFSSVEEEKCDGLISGTLMDGDMAGYKMTRAGTLYKKKVGSVVDLTVESGLSSDVFGGKAGNSFRVFSQVGNRNWFTGMLTGLKDDAETLDMDIESRPFAVLEHNGDSIVLYGGKVQRSIYYVALQNRDYWAEGTPYDNFVEHLIAMVEDARKKN